MVMSNEMGGWPAVFASAARRGGVVTLDNAREHGVPERSFRDRAERDGWSSLGAGAWLLAGCPTTPTTRHHAALAVFRPDGLLSHDTALDLLDLRDQPEHDFRIHVVIPHGRSADAPTGVLRHRSRRLDGRDRTVVDGLRVTTAARSILDVAGSVPRWRVEGLLLAARQRRLLTVDEVTGQLERRPTVRGAANVRRAIAEVGAGNPDSILEHRCRRLLLAQGLEVSSGPVVVATRGGRLSVDLVVGGRVAVECDGYAFHSSQGAFERDRVRWRELRGVGWEIVWVTWRRLHEEPLDLVAEVRRALAKTA